MRSSAVALVALGVLSMCGVTGAAAGRGRAATSAEIAAWDIDVRPDFKGLPPGSGSVARGLALWEEKCTSCHGTFGESNEVFSPIVGGTTPRDIETGRVAALAEGGVPRTTMMKLSTISTLWDYIRRAMPWTEPKSLAADDVYALVAYILNLSDVVPSDFVLSDQNIADVQRRLPNRLGMTHFPGLWDVNGRPDVQSRACMSNCPVSGEITSSLPAETDGSHGDLRSQFRLIGPSRGTASAATGEGLGANYGSDECELRVDSASTAEDLAAQLACTACHGMSTRVVGPSFEEIRARYGSDPTALSTLVDRVRGGSSEAWGSAVMPAQAHVSPSDAAKILGWILGYQSSSAAHASTVETSK